MDEIKRYAVIEAGVVTNVVLWDGVAEWTPPEGAALVQSDTLQTGDTVE